MSVTIFYLFNNLLSNSSMAFAHNKASTSTIRITKASKLHRYNISVVWTLEMSFWLHINHYRSNMAVLPFPWLHMRWMMLSYDATDCISIDNQDINFFRVRFLLLQYNKEILCWLYEGSWDMVPKKICKFELRFLFSIRFLSSSVLFTSRSTYSDWEGFPRGER